ncbi:sugar transferase [Candidatus Ponderosibacter sp. Uisw_141_02]|uniref:sugar transferase n=1 Tax=Candidatus Ponderosibacter sp. Uisw_141_02 TaxID=3231000 RepID=UPI003D3E6929
MFYEKTKRLLDVACACILLVLLWPVILLTMMLIFVKMGRPIFFVHQRSGWQKRPFNMFKFRTMHADRGQGLTDGQRITPLGLTLRQYSIDELPQLLNVLMGQMSMVGPRPLLREYDDFYSELQNQRFLMKPGMTGLAQILGRNNLTWDEKLQLDVEYVQRRSLWQDLKIIAKTPVVVCHAQGFRPSGELKKFNSEK